MHFLRERSVCVGNELLLPALHSWWQKQSLCQSEKTFQLMALWDALIVVSLGKHTGKANLGKHRYAAPYAQKKLQDIWRANTLRTEILTIPSVWLRFLVEKKHSKD